MMKGIFVSLFGLLVICLVVSGCSSQETGQVQQQVSIVQQPPPPPPPTEEELKAPPNVVLEKPGRDPFLPLAVNPVVATKGTGQERKGAAGMSGGYSLTGVMTDTRNSAIIQTGTNSFIVHSGDRVDGYRVGSITPKSVVLIGKGGKLSLSLTGK